MSPEASAILADIVVVAHLLYAATIVFGLILILAAYFTGWTWVQNRWIRGVHLLMIAIVVAEAWLGITCPLTVWERALRRQAGQPFDGNSALAKTIHQLLFFDASWWVFTGCYTACGLLIVLSLLVVPPNWSSRRSHQNSSSC